MKLARIPAIFLAAALLLAGCNVSVNEDVIIPAGGTSGGANTVNGEIVVGAGSTNDGNFKTVNGSITVEDDASTRDIVTVNGLVTVGKRASTGSIEGVNSSTECDSHARIDGDIKLVNGAVKVFNGATVSGTIKTVNGPIRLIGATVGGDVRNYNGGIVITDSSVVKGNVVVSQSMGEAEGEPPLVIIGPDSKVHGGLRFERPVRLYVHDQAEIGAGIEGAEAIPFSGSELPEDG